MMLKGCYSSLAWELKISKKGGKQTVSLCEMSSSSGDNKVTNAASGGNRSPLRTKRGAVVHEKFVFSLALLPIKLILTTTKLQEA